MLQDTSGTQAKPIYIQIAETLRDKILTGELHDAAQLPGEYDLAHQFNTSRVTLRKGLKILEDQRLILQRHGIGAFVTYNTPPRHYRIAILEIAAKGEYGDMLLAELMPALSQYNDCDFTVIKGKDTSLKSLLQKLQDHHCDGLIAIAPKGTIYRELCKPEFNTIPIVVIGHSDPQLARAGRAVVDIEPNMVGKAVDYLVQLGHKKIAYFTFKRPSNSTIQQRNRDFQLAARKLDLHVPANYRLETMETPYDSARTRIKELLTGDDPPTALLAMSPMFAFGAWQGVMELGLAIPEDISILGLECNELYNPHLSSLNQPLNKIAEAAADIMTKTLLYGKNINRQPTFLPMQIEERGSCAPPPKNRD